jgi:H+/gluconate symporter-like permease
MAWFFLEAMVALVIAVVIVWWTMGPKRGKRTRATRDDTGDGQN